MNLKKFTLFLILILFTGLAGYFLFRNYFLEQTILKLKQKLWDNFEVEVTIGKYGFEGFTRVRLENVFLVPLSGDTVFTCGSIATGFSLTRFIRGLPPLNGIIVEKPSVSIVEYPDSTNNYSYLLSRDSLPADSLIKNKEPAQYGSRVSALWNRFFALSDFNFLFKELIIQWKAPGYFEIVEVPECRLQNSGFKLKAIHHFEDVSTHWNVQGRIDGSDEIINIKGESDLKESAHVPFVEKITGFKHFIRSFSFYLTRTGGKNREPSFELRTSASLPGINHWRISPDDVMLDSLWLHLLFSFNDSTVILDTPSVIMINQIPLLSEIKFTRRTGTKVDLKINIRKLPADSFFTSLPEGLFRTLKGIRTSGFLDYHLLFSLDTNIPDSLKFDSGLKGEDFKIIKYGAENFSSLNYSFLYEAREKDRVVRVFPVGSVYPGFIPLENISPLLINAVLIAEDGTFYYHNGFNVEAFRQSIATNIKEKRFARGGSTITMQLVKNVFLNKNKTISRKLEEAIIVWLIENRQLVNKDRLLEVYLNIIEWGPGIYGIREAASFYFGKAPSELTLEESIYLSAIIPNPKAFRWTFDPQGNLRSYLKGYFNLVASRMARKEIIPQWQADSVKANVILNGPAVQFVPIDTIPKDSIVVNEPSNIFD